MSFKARLQSWVKKKREAIPVLTSLPDGLITRAALSARGRRLKTYVTEIKTF